MARVKATCSIEGCEKPAVKRTWCAMHYRRFWRHGDPLVVERIRGDLPARIESYTERRPNGCWLWTGGLFAKGYGQIQIGDKTRSVHRVVWELHHGPIPPGMTIDHECHNADPTCPAGRCDHRRCINPEHLVLRTGPENTLRGKGVSAVHARKTHCIRGHEFTPENTKIGTDGGRRCRACAVEYHREYGRTHPRKR